MSDLVEIKLHGILGQAIGESWKLSVSSVSEAIRAIEILSGRKLNKFLLDNDKNNIKYQVITNNKIIKKSFDETDREQIKNSELAINLGNLRTIDIVPVIEGAGDALDFINIFLGVTLIFAAFFAGPIWGPMLFMTGLGLAFKGIANLLAKPPALEEFREIEKTRQAVSYLFNGPENTINEGGPVPVGYGRLIIGSQNVASNYVIKQNTI
jgi:predicted phage tail protein